MQYIKKRVASSSCVKRRANLKRSRKTFARAHAPENLDDKHTGASGKQKEPELEQVFEVREGKSFVADRLATAFPVARSFRPPLGNETAFTKPHDP